MPRLAYEEILKGGYDDQLMVWGKARKKMGLCCNETKEVQERYGLIIAHVQQKYATKHQQVREFLSGADGWIIAYALATDGVVVSQENRHTNKSKIKVPTVANVFDVPCRNTPQVLDELNADFSKGVQE